MNKGKTQHGNKKVSIRSVPPIIVASDKWIVFTYQCTHWERKFINHLTPCWHQETFTVLNDVWWNHIDGDLICPNDLIRNETIHQVFIAGRSGIAKVIQIDCTMQWKWNMFTATFVIQQRAQSNSRPKFFSFSLVFLVSRVHPSRKAEIFKASVKTSTKDSDFMFPEIRSFELREDFTSHSSYFREEKGFTFHINSIEKYFAIKSTNNKRSFGEIVSGKIYWWRKLVLNLCFGKERFLIKLWRQNFIECLEEKIGQKKIERKAMQVNIFTQ